MTMSIATVGGADGMSGISAMSGASWGGPQQKATSLYNSIDTAGAGSITEAQFDQAFQTLNPPAVFRQQGAGAIFSALDPNGTGSVSKQNFISIMAQLMVSLRSDGGISTAPGPLPDLSAGSG